MEAPKQGESISTYIRHILAPTVRDASDMEDDRQGRHFLLSEDTFGAVACSSVSSEDLLRALRGSTHSRPIPLPNVMRDQLASGLISLTRDHPPAREPLLNDAVLDALQTLMDSKEDFNHCVRTALNLIMTLLTPPDEKDRAITPQMETLLAECSQESVRSLASLEGKLSKQKVSLLTRTLHHYPTLVASRLLGHLGISTGLAALLVQRPVVACALCYSTRALAPCVCGGAFYCCPEHRQADRPFHRCRRRRGKGLTTPAFGRAWVPTASSQDNFAFGVGRHSRAESTEPLDRVTSSLRGGKQVHPSSSFGTMRWTDGPARMVCMSPSLISLVAEDDVPTGTSSSPDHAALSMPRGGRELLFRVLTRLSFEDPVGMGHMLITCVSESKRFTQPLSPRSWNSGGPITDTDDSLAARRARSLTPAMPVLYRRRRDVTYTPHGWEAATASGAILAPPERLIAGGCEQECGRLRPFSSVGITDVGGAATGHPNAGGTVKWNSMGAIGAAGGWGWEADEISSPLRTDRRRAAASQRVRQRDLQTAQTDRTARSTAKRSDSGVMLGTYYNSARRSSAFAGAFDHLPCQSPQRPTNAPNTREGVESASARGLSASTSAQGRRGFPRPQTTVGVGAVKESAWETGRSVGRGGIDGTVPLPDGRTHSRFGNSGIPPENNGKSGVTVLEPAGACTPLQARRLIDSRHTVLGAPVGEGAVVEELCAMVMRAVYHYREVFRDQLTSQEEFATVLFSDDVHRLFETAESAMYILSRCMEAEPGRTYLCANARAMRVFVEALTTPYTHALAVHTLAHAAHSREGRAFMSLRLVGDIRRHDEDVSPDTDSFDPIYGIRADGETGACLDGILFFSSLLRKPMFDHLSSYVFESRPFVETLRRTDRYLIDALFGLEGLLFGCTLDRVPHVGPKVEPAKERSERKRPPEEKNARPPVYVDDEAAYVEGYRETSSNRLHFANSGGLLALLDILYPSAWWPRVTTSGRTPWRIPCSTEGVDEHYYTNLPEASGLQNFERHAWMAPSVRARALEVVSVLLAGVGARAPFHPTAHMTDDDRALYEHLVSHGSLYFHWNDRILLQIAHMAGLRLGIDTHNARRDDDPDPALKRTIEALLAKTNAAKATDETELMKMVTKLSGTLYLLESRTGMENRVARDLRAAILSARGKNRLFLGHHAAAHADLMLSLRERPGDSDTMLLFAENARHLHLPLAAAGMGAASLALTPDWFVSHNLWNHVRQTLWETTDEAPISARR
eukprot:Rmarinus@m.7536